MQRADKAAPLQAIPDQHFPAPAIPLQHRDAFTLLCAVVLSAQCTDERVNLVTPGLFALAATPTAMAALPVPRILAAIRSCGLAPQKAKALAGLARELVRTH